MDWASRRVLAWRTSNTLTTDFCLAALEETLTQYGTPEIFNTDQGNQFASTDFTAALDSRGIRISMDGKGRWVDNVFVERVWRSLKYEDIYLKAYACIAEANRGIGAYFDFCNRIRPHQSLPDRTTPDAAYFGRCRYKPRHNGRNPNFPPRRALVCVACAAVENSCSAVHHLSGSEFCPIKRGQLLVVLRGRKAGIGVGRLATGSSDLALLFHAITSKSRVTPAGSIQIRTVRVIG